MANTNYSKQIDKIKKTLISDITGLVGKETLKFKYGFNVVLENGIGEIQKIKGEYITAKDDGGMKFEEHLSGLFVEDLLVIRNAILTME